MKLTLFCLTQSISAGILCQRLFFDYFAILHVATKMQCTLEFYYFFRLERKTRVISAGYIHQMNESSSSS